MKISLYLWKRHQFLSSKFILRCAVTEVMLAICYVFWVWSGYGLTSLLYLFNYGSVLPWFPEDYQGSLGVGVAGVSLFCPRWARFPSAASPRAVCPWL
jgi:hypothetical protein